MRRPESQLLRDQQKSVAFAARLETEPSCNEQFQTIQDRHIHYRSSSMQAESDIRYALGQPGQKNKTLRSSPESHHVMLVWRNKTNQANAIPEGLARESPQVSSFTESRGKSAAAQRASRYSRNTNPVGASTSYELRNNAQR